MSTALNVPEPRTPLMHIIEKPVAKLFPIVAAYSYFTQPSSFYSLY